MNSRVKDDLVQSLKSFLPFEVVNPNPSNRYDKLLTYIKESDVPDNVNLFYPDKLTLVGNLGIGTRNPAQLLHLSGAPATGGIRIDEESNAIYQAYLTFLDTSGNFGLDVNGGGKLRFATGGVERLTILSTGNVGIGEDNPSALIHATQGGEPPAEGMLILEANTSSRQLRIQPPTTADNGFFDSRGGNMTFLDDGAEIFRYNASTISTSTGIKVGIGTASPDPDSTLHIHTGSAGSVTAHGSADDLVIEHASDAGLSILTPAANNGRIYFGSPTNNAYGQIDYDHATNDMVFATSGTGRLAITGAGNMGLGVTPTGYFADKFVVSAGNADGITIAASDTSDVNYLLFADGTSGNAAYRGQIVYDHGNDKMQFATAAAAALTIDSSQLVGIGTTTPTHKLTVVGSINNGIHVTADTDTDFDLDSGYGNDAFILKNSTVGNNNPVSMLFATGSNGEVRLSAIDDATNGDANLNLTLRRAGGSRPTVQFWEAGTGNVGIGTDSPNAPLHLESLNSPEFRISRTNNAGVSSQPLQISAYAPDASGNTAESFGDIRLRVDDATHGSEDSHWSFRSHNAGTVTEDMVIGYNGNVGIGSSSPTNQKLLISENGDGNYPILEVINTNTSANAKPMIRVGTGGDAVLELYRIGNAATTYINAAQVGNGNLAFQTESNTKMVIANDGNVGIGRDSNLQGKLDVDGDLRVTRNIASNSVLEMISLGSDRSINDYGGLYKDYWRINVVTPGPTTTGESSAHGFGDLRFSGVTGVNTTYEDRLKLRHNGRIETTNIAFSGSSIENYTSATDSGNLWVNYEGYQGGTTYFRDFKVGNGKQSVIAFFDGSSGNVGIGTDVPDTLLHISGSGNIVGKVVSTNASAVWQADSISTEASILYFTTAGSQAWKFQKAATTGNLEIRNSTDLTKFAMLDNGNVGIGTGSPNYILDSAKDASSITYNLKTNVTAAADNYAEIAFQLWSGAGSGANIFGGAGTSRPSVVLRAISEDTAARGAFAIATFSGGATNATLTEKMRIHSDGAVSIGSATRDSAYGILSLSNGNGVGNTALYIEDAGGIGYSLGVVDGSQAFSIHEGANLNSQKRFEIDTNGHIAIGGISVSPWRSDIYSVLQLKAGTDGSNAIFADSYDNFRYANNTYLETGGWKYYKDGPAAQHQIDNGGFYWYNAPSGLADASITFSELMRLEAGNLSVNETYNTAFTDTSTAAKYIGVASNNNDALFIAHSSGQGVGYFGYDYSADRLIIATDNGAGGNSIQFSVNAGTTSNGTADNLASATAAMAIDSSGRVGIGVATPSMPLEVRVDEATVGESSLVRFTRFTIGDSHHLEISVDNQNNNVGFISSGTNNGGFTMGNTAGDHLVLTSSGALLLGYTSTNGGYNLQVNSQIFATNATIATSDGRYKENVQPISNATDLVSRLNPVQFKWKSHEVHNFDVGRTDVGFIAQEIKEVLSDTDYSDSVVVSNKADDEEYLGLGETKLIPLLTAALQEAITKIEILENKVAALESV